jgi:hypothetical protein
MQFRIKITSGEEVKWAGMRMSPATKYYGGPPPETGAWRISTTRLEDFFESALKNLSFGDSIETFVLSFEIGDIEGWGNFFTSMTNYVSYRPKMKLVISVGQINWPDVKDLEGPEQFQHFTDTLLGAISRISEMKRKPKHFDVAKFLVEVRRILSECPVDKMIDTELVA